MTAQLVLDAHTHAFPDQLADRAVRKLSGDARYCAVAPSHNGTLDSLLVSMDRTGIARAFVLSVATRPAQVTKITDWAAGAATERLIPFASIHPDYDEPEREAERIAERGLRGIKFHPQYMDCTPDDPRALRIARAAEAAGLAMVFHAGYDVAFPDDPRADPRLLLRVHEAAPRLRLLFAHLGGWRSWEHVLEHLAGLPVYFETSWVGNFCPPDLLNAILEKHDSRYLLFGTDAPWRDPAEGLRHFARFPLDEQTRARVLWDNALRFAGLT